MSSTEEEARGIDAGWDAGEPSEDDVDQAWDSVPPPISAAVASSAPSTAPATEEVDSGWDDVPDGAPGPVAASGKRRPHRQRRAKTNAAVASANPVLLPRPAEPSKKHQREHARKQRAYEAQVKQQRKVEKKAQRAVEMREEAAARLRQREAQARARQEERARAESNRPAPTRKAASPKRVEGVKPSLGRAAPAVEVKRKEPPARSGRFERALRPGVVITLAVLLAVALLLVLRK